MSNELLAEIAQQAIIADKQGRVLILRRPEGKWQFAGGRLMQGEHWIDGLRREVREETGIDDLKIISIEQVDNWIWNGCPQYGVYFFCQTSTTSITLSREHDDYKWVSADDDLEDIVFFHPMIREMLNRGLELARCRL